jgi:hypothetical protein
MSTAAGRFTEETMRGTLERIVIGLGADASDAKLLRLTNNAVFALPAAGLVVRIIRSHQLHARVHKVAALGGWFAAADGPTIRLTPGLDQPVADGGVLATIWEYVPPTPPSVDAADLGVALREFHALGLPPFDLPPWDPIGDARSRLTDAEALDETDRQFLTDWCDRLQPRLKELTARAGDSLVHGDAHEGNLLRSPSGRPLLCDFDATCHGPWQIDLVPAPVGEARFGRTGGHARLAAAYGYDVTTDPDWPLLREARELKMIAAAVPLLASAPGVSGQFTLRVNSIRHGDTTMRWTPFGDLPR